MTTAVLTDTGLRNLQSARDYDHFAAQALAPWDAMFVARAAQLRPDRQAGSVLDVGAGTGVVLETLAEADGFHDWHFVGLEHFEDMVAQMRARLPQRFDVVLGDAAALPFAAGRFDMVLCRATLHHIPDKRACLTEMMRVLRPGGIALIHDPRRDMPTDIRTAFDARRAEAGYAPTTLDEKLTVAEMQALLRQTGLDASSAVYWGEDGLAAIGFEVVMRKA